jgi:transcriptional regulator with XRE-family HTH domain
MTIPKETKILSDDEVKHLLELMLDVMPYPAKEMLVLNNINPEDSIRMQSITRTFRNAREISNQTLKDVSGKTKIPQYRIRAIEEGNLAEIKPTFFRQLSKYYDLDEWCSRWAIKNTELASGLGMLSWVELSKRAEGEDLSVSALSDVEKQIMEFVESRRPEEHIRPELDIGYRITGQSFEIFEIRPRWKQPDITQEISVAKATFVKSKKVWKLYWMRADLKWHRYDSLSNTKSLQDVLKEIGEDPYCCFWG